MNFFKWTGLITAAAAAMVGGSAYAESFNVAHGYPPTHPVVAQGIVPWMACVEEKTGNAVTFIHFPSGQITSHNAAIDSVNSGVADIAAIITGYVSSQMPLNGIPLLPDMGTEAVDMVAAYRKAGDAGAAIAQEFTANKLHPLLFNLQPAYQVMSSGAPTDTLAKFSGLKTRVSAGSPSLMATALGAIPVEMSTSDMYIAMQRGTVDATFIAMASGKTYGLPELVKSVSTNGSFGSGAAVLSINLDKYNALSDEFKAAFDDCGRQVEVDLALYMDKENVALQTEFAESGITLFEFAPEELEAISSKLSVVADDYIKRLEDRGIAARETFDAYREGLTQ
ncbi:TRAP transporter substrate-binding protein DctP [Paracoccus pantotrophus]|uniref:TRAP transporter substrate-binding protein n=1 Tax=Paracoccus pantotrophus TaxID=82367 RepID=UPI0004B10D5C|nr:TRAP transporter substrate-binding protein DctP [Paracoccus pantotrophus]